MSHTHQKGCDCSSHPNSTAQTLSELEFERGLWGAAMENDTNKLTKLLNSGGFGYIFVACLTCDPLGQMAPYILF